MLLGTSGVSLLRNPLAGKNTIRAYEGTIRGMKGPLEQVWISNVASSFNNFCKINVLSDKPKFNGVYS